MKTITFIPTLALAVALPSMAGDAQMVLSGGILFNQGNTIDLTQKRTGGFNLEGGVRFSPEGFGPEIEVYAGVLRIPAAKPTATRATYELDSPHFGADLIYRPWDKLNALSIRAGLAFHIWQVDLKGAQVNANQGDQNIKLGWRTGVAYDIDKSWSVSLSYTFSEWRGNGDLHFTPQGAPSTNPDDPAYFEGVNPSRPAYFSLMASYRF